MAKIIESNTKPNPSPRPAEVLDPHGDLRLIVGKEEVVFRVCSRALARSSRVWNTMLYGSYGEGKGQQTGTDWAVPLPEDDPEGLRVVLLAIHGRFPDLPTLLDRPTLFRVVVICDKYDMVEFLRPFWAGWLGKLPYPHLDPETVIHHLWIAHKLGDRDAYRCMLKRLLVGSVTGKEHHNKTKIFLRGFESFDLDADVHLQSLDIMRKCKLRAPLYLN
jgi:hypothetical protein